MLSDLTVDDDGLAFTAAPEDLPRILDVLLDGRRIWSIRVEDGAAARDEPSRRTVAWPAPLRPFLDGVATFVLRPLDGGDDVLEARARFGTSDEPVRLVDREGGALMVNKFGEIGHALGDYDPGMLQRLLDHVDQMQAVVAAAADVDTYVMGGTLLGPYRDGHILPNDDDADIGYLSGRTHIADVLRESFRIGRALRAAGLEVLRFSGGHVQAHFEHEGRFDGYADVFTGWIDDDGWWMHAFAIRTKARRDQVLPVRTLDVEGRPEPMPREPELMLEANYGPGWRVPDPAFRFDLPRSTTDRMWGWLSDFNMDRALWEDFYRNVPSSSAEPSPYAVWLAERLPAGAPVLELGCGRGDDALWLAAQGHRVTALDYVRRPLAEAAAVAAERGLPAEFRTLNFYDFRRVLTVAAELAARREPLVVYARDLLASLWDPGRPNLLRLLSMVLRAGGTAHLDVPGSALAADPGTGVPLHRTLTVEALSEEMARHGLHVVETHAADDVVTDMPWGSGSRPLPTTRMVVTWRRTHA